MAGDPEDETEITQLCAVPDIGMYVSRMCFDPYSHLHMPLLSVGKSKLTRSPARMRYVYDGALVNQGKRIALNLFVIQSNARDAPTI